MTRKLGSLATPPDPTNLANIIRQSKALAEGALKLQTLYAMQNEMSAHAFDALRTEIIAQTKAEYADDAEWIDSCAADALFEQAKLPN
jgi:hypothetical protein